MVLSISQLYNKAAVAYRRLLEFKASGNQDPWKLAEFQDATTAAIKRYVDNSGVSVFDAVTRIRADVDHDYPYLRRVQEGATR